MHFGAEPAPQNPAHSLQHGWTCKAVALLSYLLEVFFKMVRMSLNGLRIFEDRTRSLVLLRASSHVRAMLGPCALGARLSVSRAAVSHTKWHFFDEFVLARTHRSHSIPSQKMRPSVSRVRFSPRIDSRLRQVSSRHEEILENLDRTDEPHSGGKKTEAGNRR